MRSTRASRPSAPDRRWPRLSLEWTGQVAKPIPRRTSLRRVAAQPPSAPHASPPYRLLSRGCGSRRGGESQVVPSDNPPARPFDIDEKRQGRLDDRLRRRHSNVAASTILLDDLEFEELEVIRPRQTGELELSRGAQHDLHSLEIAGLHVAHGDPGIQRLVPLRSGFYQAYLECRCARRGEERQAHHGYD